MANNKSTHQMYDCQELIGQTFGLLLVLACAPSSKSNGKAVLCRCQCGREVVVAARFLRRGTTSCGCLFNKAKITADALPSFPDIPEVEFRLCPSYLGYAASSDGGVWSCRSGFPNVRRPKWRRLNGWKNALGYWTARIGIEGRQKTMPLRQMVADAFHGPRPPGMIVCHNNGMPGDDRPENLRWDTHKANTHDAIAQGTFVMPPRNDLRGERSGTAKLTWEQVRTIRRLAANREMTRKALASQFSVSTSLIDQIIWNTIWKE